MVRILGTSLSPVQWVTPVGAAARRMEREWNGSEESRAQRGERQEDTTRGATTESDEERLTHWNPKNPSN